MRSYHPALFFLLLAPGGSNAQVGLRGLNDDRDRMDQDSNRSRGSVIKPSSVEEANTDKYVDYYSQGEPFQRFSKVEFFHDYLREAFLPLKSYNFPISGPPAAAIRTQSLAHSPFIPSDYEVRNVKVEEIIEGIGGRPTFPLSENSTEFWYELYRVAMVQDLRRKNTDPKAIMKRMPDIWDGFDIHQVAEAVNDEQPGIWHLQLLQYLSRQNLRCDYSVVPFRSEVDFVGTAVRFSSLATWAIGTISPTAFLVKWTVGRIRPEEAAFQIALGMLTTEEHGVPAPLVSLIQSWNLSSPQKFTAYDVGCPPHPSWPAMHSAASAASLWLPVVADLTEEQLCQVLLTDYAISYARTIAGVHYETDNIAGLNLGQQVMAEALPRHMATNYGSNEESVRQKIESLRFDWKTFDPVTCSVTYTNRR